MIRLALSSLRNRWSRTLTAVIGIAMAISIAYVMSGVTEAFQSETTRTLEALGAVEFLVPEASSGLLNTLIEVTEVPEGTVPVLFARDSLPQADVDLNLFGVEPDTVAVAEGRSLGNMGEAVVDVGVGADLGSSLTLAGRDVEVVGITDGTRMFAGGPVVYLHIDDARDLYFNGRPVAHFFAAAEPVDASDGLAVMSFAQAKNDIDRAVRGAISSLALTTALLWLMVAGVVFVLNRLTLLDRRSELATLKCLGAGSWVMGMSLVVEGVFVGMLGAILGCLGGVALAPLFPLAVEASAATARQVIALTAGVSMLVAVLATLQLRSVTPSEAFRGEV